MPGFPEFFANRSRISLKDDFNLTGLNVLVPYYDYALDMVLDVEMPMEDSLTEEQQEIVESAAVCYKFVVNLVSWNISIPYACCVHRKCYTV